MASNLLILVYLIAETAPCPKSPDDGKGEGEGKGLFSGEEVKASL